jgi:hypothetical protein
MMDVMASLFKEENAKYMAVMFFGNLADARAKDVEQYDETFIAALNSDTNINTMAANLLGKLGTDKVFVNIIC